MISEKGKEEEEERVSIGPFTNHILNFIRSDKLAIILFIIALLACSYTIITVGDYQDKINSHWVNEFKTKNCVCSRIPINFNGSPTLPLLNIELPLEND